MLFVGSLYKGGGGDDNVLDVLDDVVSLILSVPEEDGAIFGCALGLGDFKAPVILAGTKKQSTLSLRTVSDETAITLNVVLGEVQGQLSLVGSWTNSIQHSGGSTVLLLQSDGPSSRTRQYRGESVPDVSLQPFMIPCNPICWVLCVLQGGRVLGAGIFDDSGDVPGKSTLHFSLMGHMDDTGYLQMIKVYEHAEQTKGHYVEYRGRFAEGILQGTWRNPGASSFGQFRAHPMSSEKSPHIRLCDECFRLIAPGQLRWKHPESSEVLCDMCKEDGRLELVPSLQQHVVLAEGPCVSHLLWDALSKFPHYAKLKVDCLAIVSGFMVAGLLPGGTVAIVGETRDPLTSVGVIAAFLAGAVVAAVPPQYAEALLELLKPSVTLSLDDIRSAAAKETAAFSLPPVRQRSETAAILFSSGTTGTPKPVYFTEELLLPTNSGMSLIFPYRRVDFQSFDPSFIVSLITSLFYGGTRLRSSPATLLQDLPQLQPTHLGAPPTVWNALYSEYLSRGADASAASQVRQMLGPRLKVATCGGAPLSRVCRQFVREQLQIDLSTLYASRECGSVAKNGRVFPGVSVILVDGEICVNSSRIVLTAPSVFRDGKQYVRTGDLGRLSDDGRDFEVLGRAGSTFKAQDGLFVYPDLIEASIEQCVYVKHALLMPNMVAIIVPRRPCTPSEMLFNIRVVLGRNQRSPSNVLLLPVDESWDDLMTTSGKKRRSLIQSRYQQQVDDLPPLAQENFQRGEFSLLLADLFPDLVISSPHVTLPQLGLNSIAIARISASNSQRWTPKMLYSATIAELDALCRGDVVDTAAVLASAEVDFLAESQNLSLFDSEAGVSRLVGDDILLIGATGFLGPYILQQLRVRYPSRRIFALCRKAPPVAQVPEGVSVVLGDVTLPRLGISDEILSTMKLGAVIHSAAKIHSELPYHELKAVNVDGTLRAAALARTYGAKFCFVSSIAALGDFESKNGYGQSKRVAEALLGSLQRDRGLRLCSLMRLGAVSCTLDGRGRPDDVVWSLLALCKRLGCAPRRCSVQLNWAPVDFVARCVAECSEADHAMNVVGHGPPLALLLEALRVERVDVAQWRRRVEEHLEESPTRAILLRFEFQSAGVGAHLLERENPLGAEWPVYDRFDFV